MPKETKITQDSLRGCLPTEYKDLRIYVFDQLPSTNDCAKQLASEGAPDGTIVMAHKQSSGKGRLGRSFFSPEEGIYMSVIIRPEADDFQPGLVTCAAAAAVCEAIEAVTGHNALIKWVNDIYVEGKKVCGILTEGVTDHETGKLDAAIVGIGINTTTAGFPEELLQIAGAVAGEYSKSQLASSVISRLLDHTAEISDASAVSPPSFMKSYREKNLVPGKQITVYKGIYKNDPSEVPSRPARALDIDDNGGLIVLYSDGSRETLTSGEISIRI